MSPPDPTLRLLEQFECRNVTFVDAAGGWPIVWKRARGVHVWDVQNRRYLDLTAAFGVAATGHTHPVVTRAGCGQLRALTHAMGDVHPHPLKARLARELSRITFERWTRGKRRGKTIFCNSGFEAVEAALKTAMLATGKPGIIGFEGGYHGLGYGALNATHRPHFRGRFLRQLAEFGQFAPFPTTATSQPGVDLECACAAVERAFGRHSVGAVLVEPIQGRGGIRVPPAGFLPALRRLCDRHGALLIADEIFTGFGRTGAWFGCEHARVQPDLICLGKALTNGFPLSACVGRAELMDRAWPRSTGEAIHTSTYLGHPVGCAMALAQIQLIRSLRLPRRARSVGAWLLRRLQGPMLGQLPVRARGAGLMMGLEINTAAGLPAPELALAVMRRALDEGLILLPEGDPPHVLGVTPPLTIGREDLFRALRILLRLVADAA